MPWTDKPGGGSSSNNNSSNGGGRGPWGQPANGQGGGNGRRPEGRAPADLEELLKSGRDRFRRGRGGDGRGAPPGQLTMPSRPVIIGGIVLLAVLYFFSGVYQVPPGARGVVTTFGAYSGVTTPGLNWHVPWPVQDSEVVQVEEDRNVTLQRTSTGGRIGMLTSDLNIVDVEMTVNFRIMPDGALEEGELPNAAKFLYNIEQRNSAVDRLVRSAAESALRQVVGASDFEPIISRGRAIVQSETQQILQEVLDSYDSGIEIRRVNFGDATPPEEVVPSQRDVIDARSEAERQVNDATRYRNSRVPQAVGEAREIELQAEAYAQRTVREANGQARRFKDIYAEYQQAPEVTRQRMYLETMEGVLGEMNKIVIDQEAGGTLPYLNINELARGNANARGAASPSGQGQ